MADVSLEGPTPHLISVQAGSFTSSEAAAGAAATVEKVEPAVTTSDIRTTPLERFQEAKRTVDLSKSEIIVAVGRGIKEAENLPVVEKLAEALGGQLAGSRPICDSGWLPMERQVGSSGQTVAPKLYFAVGISGAIQHLVGMKGSRKIVAINKDQNAPIFDVADLGIVGNLFDVVPAITEEVQRVRQG
jgi:electron transfer flavoprotein alpha subunit